MATIPTPITIGSATELPNLQDYSYTAQDYNSLKERAIRLLQQKFGDDFNDFVESDYAIMVVEVVAFLLDILSYKADFSVNELLLDTVSQKRSLKKLAKLVSYTPSPRAPATAYFSLSVPEAYNVDITVPKRTSVSRTGSDGTTINYELFPLSESGEPMWDDYLVLSAGDTQILSCIGVEGVTLSSSYTSDGSSFQTVTIEEDDVLEGYFRVWINRKLWEQVDSFDPTYPREIYKIDYDKNNYPRIIFADNTRGLIPPNGAEISIEYRTGGGARGNVVSSFYNQTINISDVFSDLAAPLTIINYTQGTGGTEGETLAQSKYNLPLWVSAQERAVSGEDYTYWANSYSSSVAGAVGKANAVLRHSGCAGNIVDIYTLETDGENLTVPSERLKDSLLTFINEKKMLTDDVYIRDGAVLYQNIFISLAVLPFYKKFLSEIEAEARERISNLFDVGNWSMGQPLRKIDIIKTLSTMQEVNQVQVVFTTTEGEDNPETVATEFYELIRPQEIEITFAVEE